MCIHMLTQRFVVQHLHLRMLKVSNIEFRDYFSGNHCSRADFRPVKITEKTKKVRNLLQLHRMNGFPDVPPKSPPKKFVICVICLRP